ncbi:LytR/AlgR family response regulator transcription factor [Pleomorphovibrio marinus]|uniref:LytR/AlgR family response regulator transcription factor n=1 Tax=Pleomorphovibrio marinus TaxID=2164132 RepID=UPI000E0AB681|nr:LytTR family DNA-binding domain-containing protein [Pleomorphovibrio marinus]
MRQPIKSILIDDERLVLDNFCYLTKKNYPELIHIEIYEQPTLFLSDFLKGNINIDLLFIGIDMYPYSGIDLLENMEKSNIPMDFNIILLGAFDPFSMDVFKYNGIDFLEKPISSESLEEMIKNWQARHNKINTPLQFKIILNHYISNNNTGQKRIAIPNSEGFEILKVSKIIRCEGQRNYTKIIYKGKKEGLIVSKNLKELENLLKNEGFIRVHNSFLINPKFIVKILKSDGGLLEMTDEAKIRITRNREMVMNYFLRY